MVVAKFTVYGNGGALFRELLNSVFCFLYSESAPYPPRFCLNIFLASFSGKQLTTSSRVSQPFRAS
jgi:hypothetical protein